MDQSVLSSSDPTTIYARYIPQIQKRDGRLVAFEFGKVAAAISKAMAVSGEGSPEQAVVVATMVASELVKVAQAHKSFVPTVEGCQDEVERQLMLADCTATAKSYILYRAQRNEERERERAIPPHVRRLADESAEYFEGNPLGEFVNLRTYARWIEEEGRRETWVETVQRYMDFMEEKLGDKLTREESEEVHQAILEQEVMPSMRLLQFAGEPVRRCNSCAYNCTYGAPDSPAYLAEMMYLAMQGCGDGDAVETYNVQKFPQIERQTGEPPETFVIPDTKEGWCDAFRLGLETWYSGHDVVFDYSQIRPAGARLRTMGGKASGPGPLRELLDYTRHVVLSRQGRRLRNIDVLDLICMSGKCVVAGGVRRTAKITLSDLDDTLVRDAKRGRFSDTHPHRGVSNNSAVYEERPSDRELLEEWLALATSGTGERGIFNRGSLPRTVPQRRLDYWEKRGIVRRRDDGTYRLVVPVGTNPCAEIILLPEEFCNLSETIARAGDTQDDLRRKQRIASIIGTYQSTLTDFQYLSPSWKRNCEEERLLGVSITGQWDCPEVWTEEFLEELCEIAVGTNVEYAERFGISPSLAVTCVKPSGTVAKVVNASAGMHRRPAPYYIQRIRISASDALFRFMRDQGVPHHPEVGEDPLNPRTYVLEFPVRAPAGSVFEGDLSAIDQLEYWKKWKAHYTEHNPSTTIKVGPDEWIAALDWVRANWDIIGGLSFLPRDDHDYQLAPEEPITRERYEELSRDFPRVDYARLLMYEREDETEMSREAACASGECTV